MILGTVGNDPRGFQRLVDWLDRAAAGRSEPVVIQVGHTPKPPRSAHWFGFEAPEVFEARVAGARCVVTHAGAGSLLACAAAGVPAILLPRRADLREAIDGHQQELADALAGRPGYVVARSEHELVAALDRPPGRPEPPGLKLVERLRLDLEELAPAQEPGH